MLLKLALLLGYVAVGWLGFYVGIRLTHRMMIWHLRMHFYRQGFNHKAVDQRVAQILEHELPPRNQLNNIMDHRREGGLKP